MPTPLLIPKASLAIAWMTYRTWRRLPPAQRAAVLEAARTHGPKLAVAATAAAKGRLRRRQTPDR